jgi:hypothetical protein
VNPYQIPYRILLPKREECINLLCPVPFSASHIAFASLRMEPQWMIIGHAAGVAASLAHTASKPPHEIDIRQLQEILREQGGVFEYVAPAQNSAVTKLQRYL